MNTKVHLISAYQVEVLKKITISLLAGTNRILLYEPSTRCHYLWLFSVICRHSKNFLLALRIAMFIWQSIDADSWFLFFFLNAMHCLMFQKLGFTHAEQLFHSWTSVRGWSKWSSVKAIETSFLNLKTPSFDHGIEERSASILLT